MYLYIKVSRDKYELPLAVGASVKELAELTGCKRRTITSMISHKQRGYVKIDVEDYEE